MRRLATAISCVALGVSIWLAWLSRRPIEYSMFRTTIDLMRISGLAVGIGLLTAAVVGMASRRSAASTAVASVGAAGVLTVVGAARRSELPAVVVVLTNAAWLAGAAAVVGAIIAAPRYADFPRRRRTVALLAIVGGSGIATAVLGGGSGLGATIGASPSTDVQVGARAMLAVHLVLLIVAVTWVVRCWWRDADSRGVQAAVLRDPVLICGAVWFVAVVIERVVHLAPLDTFRDPYFGTYRDWALVFVVHFPLIAAGAVIGAIGWSIAVRPHVERLPSGTFVLPDSDPVAMLRDDLADWVGDPTLQLAFADGTGRWIAPTGEVDLDDLRYDRATTIVTRGGRPIGVLDHDLGLTAAPDALHTAANLAGLAFDANQLLAVSEGRLAEARRLGERLLGADTAMRAEVEVLLDDGPIRRLRQCADDLNFGAPISSVVDSIRQATTEVRELSHGLYPPELIEEGLSAVVGDRRGAPRRRLPPAVEVTAFRLVSDDPTGWFEDHGTLLRVHVQRHTISPSVLDRIAVLGGTVMDGAVDLSIEMSSEERARVTGEPEDGR